MASQLEIVGEIACSCCGKAVPVKVQKNGLAMVYCSWCGAKLQSYGEKSSDIIKSRMSTAGVEQKQEKTPDTPPTAEPKPEQKPKSGFWA